MTKVSLISKYFSVQRHFTQQPERVCHSDEGKLFCTVLYPSFLFLQNDKTTFHYYLFLFLPFYSFTLNIS
ncbi:hypothetical protein C1637_19895 [Chryseobacterium lactis]|uniref:Uncharacterized protein n=1 Tax=Chryseobacterium lactis TaxID=1241981 RepID=A0A3G6RH23_CHRLC|nr:hypothetical protein EG342_14920 [Chryseobacterium lactis]AZB03478.1 hypothetical protein EG341_05790 [Chryseobacterium lactis]PNW12018.1 hypothetical protein C1637_19895 [Chryseobacterium lactis]